ncbi:hypothetical protein FEM48_Zijuj12G0126800 [Ziziphus jujuba var. spinosa]|uniref:Pentatricopeptide repeat-containing protein n=1 Tax=Ziziphus jujuba var. spinosa TaxID=714518 RepID=A0A978UDE0_ZIZJJ|nr:hypothetical protein FEM48_Zijuj12G0126800 [Ziziphus jujuba var. spinosa]
MGKWFHACVIKTGFESHLHVASSILDMYSKCGSIKEACQLFNKMEDQNLVTWTAMLSGYAQNGLGRESVELFSRMKEAGLKPDSITFVGVLTASSHAGLVEAAEALIEKAPFHLKSKHLLWKTLDNAFPHSIEAKMNMKGNGVEPLKTKLLSEILRGRSNASWHSAISLTYGGGLLFYMLLIFSMFVNFFDLTIFLQEHSRCSFALTAIQLV